MIKINNIIASSMNKEASAHSIIKESLENDIIQKFINENNLSEEIVNKYLNNFISFNNSYNKCIKCSSLSECTQNTKGECVSLNYDQPYVTLEYIPCKYQIREHNELSKIKDLDLIGINFDCFDFNDFYTNEPRKNILSKVKKILSNKPINDQKGLYLHGSYGSGKTYIMAFCAKKINDLGNDVVFAYYPELVRLIKNSFKDNTSNDILEKLKKVSVLFLDDIGGETPSNYNRDEILLPILQERMISKKLTFMTSNLNLNDLQKHLAEGNKEIDVIRASRVFERIRVLMDFEELTDKNYR